MILPTSPSVSVIIPTFNRKALLHQALISLARQTYPMDQFEAIVVDDGSTDDSRTIAEQQFPFTLRYISQKNQGATAARNYGATISQSEVLVFMDDDVTISPQTLEALVEKCRQETSALVMGTIGRRHSGDSSIYTSVVLSMPDASLTAHDDVEFPFLACNSELLACKRKDYFELGMLQDPTAGQGWPNWDDVDFGYRAHLKGFRIVGASKAIAEHWDCSISDRANACRRFYRAGRSAAWLFKRHPQLQTLVPMLYDKTPLAWGKDSPLLIARKSVRRLVSSPPALGGLARLASILEQYFPSPALLRRIYYLLHGANLFQGYREGLREIGLAKAQQ